MLELLSFSPTTPMYSFSALAEARGGLETDRYESADLAFAQHDFDSRVESMEDWETSTAEDSWIRTVFLHSGYVDGPTIPVRFSVRFRPGTADVLRAGEQA